MNLGAIMVFLKIQDLLEGKAHADYILKKSMMVEGWAA
jgi:hypothetical protein